MSFSILPKELIITIFTYVDYETINDLDLHTSTKLYLTEINNKELQLHFINNYSFIEYKNNLVKSQYIFDIFFESPYYYSNYLGNKNNIFFENPHYYFNYLSNKKQNYFKKIILNSNPLIYNNYAIKIACKNNYTEFLKLLLQDKRIDPSFDNNYLLTCAQFHNYTKIVKILLTNHRVINIIEYQNRNILYYNICILLSLVGLILGIIIVILVILFFFGFHIYKEYHS